MDESAVTALQLAGDESVGLGLCSLVAQADPVAILVQFLVAFGSAVGRGPYFQVEADRHHLNEYMALVGQSSKGRKGTSWGRVRAVFEHRDDVYIPLFEPVQA